MTTYQDLLENARAMEPGEADAWLRLLLTEPRFVAVVNWIDRNRESFAMAVSDQARAAEHGRLAHAAGSLHAMHVLAAQLANILKPAPLPPGGMVQPEEEA